MATATYVTKTYTATGQRESTVYTCDFHVFRTHAPYKLQLREPVVTAERCAYEGEGC
jgi:hypothetical protein